MMPLASIGPVLREAGVESALRTILGAAHGDAEFHSLENMEPISAFFDRHLGTTGPKRTEPSLAKTMTHDSKQPGQISIRFSN